MNYQIRLATGQDLNFIYDTFLKSLKHDSALGKSCKTSVFFREYRQVLDYILAKDETQVLVACLPDDENVILAYLISEPSVLHYAFTKESFRRLGIAKALFSHAFPQITDVVTTHKTNHSEEISRAHNLQFNPFSLYQKDTNHGQ